MLAALLIFRRYELCIPILIIHYLHPFPYSARPCYPLVSTCFWIRPCYFTPNLRTELTHHPYLDSARAEVLIWKRGLFWKFAAVAAVDAETTGADNSPLKEGLWLELDITASIYWNNYAFKHSWAGKKKNIFWVFFPHLKSIKDCRWMVLASHAKDCFLFWFRHHVKAIFMYIVSFSSIWERVFPHNFPALKQCSLNSNHQSSPGLIGLSPPHSLRLTLCLLRKLSGC